MTSFPRGIGPDLGSAAPELTAWFGRAGRRLPWRQPPSPGPAPHGWGVLVSEVMLQQTQVDRVIPAWTSWMERWPEPADLAAAEPADVIRAWGRLGYPRRGITGGLVYTTRNSVPDDRIPLQAVVPRFHSP